MANERLKRCWINYTQMIDNLSSAYFSVVIFCDNVVRYSEKKTKQHFLEKRANKDANRKHHQHQNHFVNTFSKAAVKDDDPINLNEIEQSRFTRSQARELRDVEPISVKEKDSSKYLAPTQSKKASESEYKYISQNETTRSKQDKLNELVATHNGNIRRSGRNLHKSRQLADDEVHSLSYC